MFFIQQTPHSSEASLVSWLLLFFLLPEASALHPNALAQRKLFASGVCKSLFLHGPGYQSSRVVVTQDHVQASLNNTSLFLTDPQPNSPQLRRQQVGSFGGWEGVCVPGALPVSGSCRQSLAYRSIAPISVFTFCCHPPCGPVYVQISPFYEDTSHTGSGAHPTVV